MAARENEFDTPTLESLLVPFRHLLSQDFYGGLLGCEGLLKLGWGASLSSGNYAKV